MRLYQGKKKCNICQDFFTANTSNFYTVKQGNGRKPVLSWACKPCYNQYKKRQYMLRGRKRLCKQMSGLTPAGAASVA